jgi:hypothetical protein
MRALGLGLGLGLALGLVVAGGCSGKPRSDEPTPAVVRGDAGVRDASSSGGPPSGGPPSGAHATGDLQIRVEWRDVPVVARSSPGRTPCNTPRAPAVAPTTTWGVPDALVLVDGAIATGGEARVTLADCAFSARIAIGATLAITSAVDRPTTLTLRKRGPITALAAGEPRLVRLPIAGHTVTTALDPGAIYTLETDAPDPEVAFIASLPGAYLTEATGQVTIHGLAVGAHAVTAWLPPRAGQPARTGHATATITANDLAELTVSLAP